MLKSTEASQSTVSALSSINKPIAGDESIKERRIPIQVAQLSASSTGGPSVFQRAEGVSWRALDFHFHFCFIFLLFGQHFQKEGFTVDSMKVKVARS